ncbi:MAG: hypothetical protein ACREQI_14335 [Candidatus Binataceae bacterium]
MANDPKIQDSLDDYIWGGYYIAKLATDYKKSNLVPDAIITLSDCIAEFLPDSDWSIDWMSSAEEREKRAEKCGFPSAQRDAFVKWSTELMRVGKFGLPNVLLSMETATELLRRFPFDRSEWHLLGAGLRKDEVDRFIALCAPPTYQGQGQDGVYEALVRKEQLHRSGRILGYDVLGHEEYGGGFHSWFCNSLEEEVAEKLGIRPDHNGLLKTYAEAAACAQYAGDPDTHAEPASWNAWVLVDYPI